VFYEYTESDHPRDWPSRQQLRVAHGRLFRTPQLFHVEQLCWQAQELVEICAEFGLAVQAETAV
jgi:hypothetical protein